MLTEKEKNTLEISGKINRTAERYLEIMRHHGIELTETERQCLTKICDFGFMATLEIQELADEVRAAEFEVEGLDREALIRKLESASFADLVAVVEELGF
jgi:FixJ family two-component response regulator